MYGAPTIDPASAIECAKENLRYILEEEYRRRRRRCVNWDIVVEPVESLVEHWAAEIQGLSVEEVFDSLCSFAGRRRGPFLLEHWWDAGLIDDEALRQRILDVWSNANIPQAALGVRRWLKLFKATGFLSDGHPTPTEALTVYRGHNLGWWRGMSWTETPDCAHSFAGWWKHIGWSDCPGDVFRTTVAPKHVLAIYDGRGESEIIVNTYGLRWSNVECLGPPDPKAIKRWSARVAEFNDTLLAD